MRCALRIIVRGQVQGVGFRPFVFRLAQQCQLGGSVRNSPSGVVIDVEGLPHCLARFRAHLVTEAPPGALIEAVGLEPIAPSECSTFVIEASDSDAPPLVRVPRDLAICLECRSEIVHRHDRRLGYAFTNCTTCGPRYSIVTAMPYDRSATTMHQFTMCAECQDEHDTPDDRRFHAQPNACASCGPQMELWDRQGRALAPPSTTVTRAAELLRRGQIVALKGLGGFQLLVRADEQDAVLRLRQRKHRPTKPLAVMVPGLTDAERLAYLGSAERALLESPQNPIVLVDKRPGMLAGAVAPQVRTLGLLFPTTPLHHLLLAELNMPVVATSGNRTEEPIVTDEREAVRRLSGIADAFLVHNRPIVRGVDDSVVRVIGGQPVTLRLARGHAPLPLPTLEAYQRPPILATGGHQKTAPALWTGSQAVLAQHVGDLDHPETRAAFHRTARDLAQLYHCQPAEIACDLHPDYFSTRWAFEQDRPVCRVQHHHAHALACMVEHDLLDREVLAFAWDGTGHGTDGTIWGGEVLRVRRNGFERVASLMPFPLPGGAAAIRHPNRVAFGLLRATLGEEAIWRGERCWHKHLGLPVSDAKFLASMIRRKINTPWSSSVGRLFDAVAALVLNIHEVSHEGEAATWLEAVADPAVTDAYPLPMRQLGEHAVPAGDLCLARADWRPMVSAILQDLDAGETPGVIAARFHNALAGWAAAVVVEQPQHDVVLSGGCFQNRLLTERTLELLRHAHHRIYTHSKIPPGDGGLAAGQLALAMTGSSEE